MKIGLLHPGEMGASIGAVLHQTGHQVFYLASGRSVASRERADKAGLQDAGSLTALLEQVEVVFSVCPPSAAFEVEFMSHSQIHPITASCSPVSRT